MADVDQSQAPEDTEGKGEEGGFGTAFSERAKDPGGDRPDTAEAEAGEASAEGGEGSADAGPAQAPGKPAADKGSGIKAPAFDPYAGLSPESAAHFKSLEEDRTKLQASERSQRGRVGALTKKLNQLSAPGTHKPPAAAESGQSAESDEGAGGTGTGNGDEPSASSIEARLKAATEEYGDIVGPLAEVVDELRQEIAGLKASATRTEVDADAADMAEAYAKLEAAHPDYAAVAASPEYETWFLKQPKGVQALANSYDPQEVSLNLSLFKADQASSQASGEEGEGGNGSTATGTKRERQMDGLRQTTTRGAPAASGTPKDFKSAFKERATAT